VNLKSFLYSSDPTLLAVGDNVIIEDDVDIQTLTTVDGIHFVAKRVVIESDVTILSGCVIRGGTCVGAGSTCGINSVLQGDIPPRSLAIETEVIDADSEAAKAPHVQYVCSMATLTTGDSTVGLLVGYMGFWYVTEVAKALIFSSSAVASFGILGLIDLMHSPIWGHMPVLFDPVPATFAVLLVLAGGLALLTTALLSVVFALVVKYLVIGFRFDGEARTVTSSYILLNHAFAYFFTQAHALLVGNPVGFKYSPMERLWYQLFGLRCSRSATLSPIFKEGRCDLELIELQDYAYMSAGVRYRTLCVERQPDGSYVAIYGKLTVEPDGFVAPGSILLGGVTVASQAMVCEISIGMPIYGERRIPSGTAVIGCRGSKLKYKPDMAAVRAFKESDSIWLHDLLLATLSVLRSTYFATAIFCTPFVGAFVGASLSTRLVTSILHSAAGTWQLYLFAPSAGAMLFHLVLFPLAVEPILALLTIGVIRLHIIGMCDLESKYSRKGAKVTRFISALAMGTDTFFEGTPPKLWHATGFVRFLYRVAGAQIGRHVVLQRNYPVQPETQLLTIGDCTTLHDAPKGLGVYMHAFAQGYLQFKPCTIGSGARIGGSVIITPGSTVPDGVRVMTLTVVMSMTAPPSGLNVVVHGNPCRVVTLDSTDNIVHENYSAPLEWLAPASYKSGAAQDAAEQEDCEMAQSVKGGAALRPPVRRCCLPMAMSLLVLVLGLLTYAGAGVGALWSLGRTHGHIASSRSPETPLARLTSSLTGGNRSNTARAGNAAAGTYSVPKQEYKRMPPRAQDDASPTKATVMRSEVPYSPKAARAEGSQSHALVPTKLFDDAAVNATPRQNSVADLRGAGAAAECAGADCNTLGRAAPLAASYDHTLQASIPGEGGSPQEECTRIWRTAMAEQAEREAFGLDQWPNLGGGVVSSDVADNWPGPMFNFVHVGKTCGTSVTEFLVSSGLRYDYGAYGLSDQIHVHPMTNETLGRSPRVLITLRDPVDRVVSAFYFNRHMRELNEYLLGGEANATTVLMNECGFDTVDQFAAAVDDTGICGQLVRTALHSDLGEINSALVVTTASNDRNRVTAALRWPFIAGHVSRGACFYLGGLLEQIEKKDVYVVETETCDDDARGIPKWLGAEQLVANWTFKRDAGGFEGRENNGSSDEPPLSDAGRARLRRHLAHETFLYNWLQRAGVATHSSTQR